MSSTSTTRDEMTISDWLTLQPTTEEVANGFSRKTEYDDGDAHKALILSLFDGVEKMKIASLITDAVGALYVVEPRYTIVVLKHLLDTLSKDFMLSQLPPGLATLIGIILEDD